MTWLAGWAKRVKLTIDQADIDAILSNFPILLYLSISSGRLADDISFIFDEIGANKLKIAVTTSDGTTQCYVEIEKWDNTNEKAWLWVKVPTIDADVDTDLYLYYDNNHADNTDYVGDIESVPAMAVWDANFLCVYHLRDKTTNAVADSTGNNYDGTKTGANQPIVVDNGKIGDCQDFDGTNDRIDCQDVNIGTAARTFEAWEKADVVNITQAVVGKDAGGANEAGMIYFANAVGYWRLRSAVNEQQRLFATAMDTSWHYLVGGYTPNQAINVYRDGILDNGELQGANLANVTDNTTDLEIGARGNNSLFFNGQIDEVRVSIIERSASWIKATRQSGIDNLIDWGTEETEGGLSIPVAMHHYNRINKIIRG